MFRLLPFLVLLAPNFANANPIILTGSGTGVFDETLSLTIGDVLVSGLTPLVEHVEPNGYRWWTLDDGSVTAEGAEFSLIGTEGNKGFQFGPDGKGALMLFAEHTPVPTVVSGFLLSLNFSNFVLNQDKTLSFTVDRGLVRYEAHTPEPSTWALLLAGLMLAVGRSGRRRRLQPLSS
jgi:hypothetical protein